MHFDFLGMYDGGFEEWVAKVKAEPSSLDRGTFQDLQEHSVAHPVTYFGSVDTDLWDAIVNMCVDENTLCKNDMMMVDALGGGGLDGLYLREIFAGICTVDDPRALFASIRSNKRMTVFDNTSERFAQAELEDQVWQQIEAIARPWVQDIGFNATN